jgi:hypothetical protein
VAGKFRREYVTQLESIKDTGKKWWQSTRKEGKSDRKADDNVIEKSNISYRGRIFLMPSRIR